MQAGDLEAWEQPRIVIVIEGVLCRAIPMEERKRRFRKTNTVRYHYGWYDVPLKRLAVNKMRYPEVGHDVVTFLGPEFLDGALEFLDEVRVPYDSAYANNLRTFCESLRFRREIQAVYDSDPTRLDQYGQLGKSVVAGEDW
jgi:hypothetical protein